MLQERRFVWSSSLLIVGIVSLPGCGEQDQEDTKELNAMQRLGTQPQATFVYYQCGATGEGLTDSTRMQQGPEVGDWTLTYSVSDPSATTGADECTIVETNQLNGWGTRHKDFKKLGPNLLKVPQSGTAVAKLALLRPHQDPRFGVRYPALGRYRATFHSKSLWLEVVGVPNPSWKIQVLKYTDTDFAFTDSQGAARRVVASMSEEQRQRVYEVATRFVAEQVPMLTSGNQAPNLEFVTVTRPLTHISRVGTDCYWPAREDVLADIDRTADSVVVFWDSSGTDVSSGEPYDLMGCAAGLAVPGGSGQTYLVIQVNWWSDSWRFENDLKHEWGHSILSYFSAMGLSPEPTVDNHQPTAYVNCKTGQPYVADDDPSVPNSYYSLTSGFTHDYYSGLTALASNPTVCLGITPHAWAVGGPEHKGRITPLPLANSGFEKISGSPPLPVDWSTSQWASPVFSVDPTTKRSGTYSARIDGADLVDGKFMQAVEVEPNTLYRLSGYVRTENVACEGHGGAAAVVEIADVWPLSSATVSGTTEDWTWVHVDFNSGNATTVILEARIGMFGNMCAGTVWFDDFSFGRVES